MMIESLAAGAGIDVAVIGGGPAGLAAATELKRRGIARVVVLEREEAAGGIPRHCGHPPFGWREFRRILTGPTYAKRLVLRATKAGVEIHCSASVTGIAAGPCVSLSMPDGIGNIFPRRVIYTTGVRESPRSARLVSGARTQGILNTGALQSMVYLESRRPFRNPVIVGTELVSFSALQTCRHAGIKPVAMIEPGNRTTARRPAGAFASLLGVPVKLQTRLCRINGDKHVRSVEVSNAGGVREIPCDGVLLTGEFTPESSLARMGHLQIDRGTGGPVVDQFGRCSDANYFATGNVLRAVETAGWSWAEGRDAGRIVAEDLQENRAAPTRQIPVYFSDPLLKLVMPQKLSVSGERDVTGNLQVRFNGAGKGFLKVFCDGGLAWSKPVSALPERRYLIPLAGLIDEKTAVIQVEFSP